MPSVGPFKKPPAMDPTDDEETPPTKVWSVRGCLHDFSQSTSMHGAARVGNKSSHFLVRVFWFLLLLTAVGWSIFNIYQIVLNYQSRPVATVVTVMFEENVRFPAVTVCNLNNIRNAEFQNFEAMGYKNPYDTYNYDYGSGSGDSSGSSSVDTTSPSASSSSATSNDTTTSSTTADTTSSDPDASTLADTGSGSGFGSGYGSGDGSGYNYGYEYYNWYNEWNDYPQVSYEYDLSIKNFLKSLPPLNRSRLGHSMQKMLIDCRYQRESCTHRNFTRFWNQAYGNCFTFNKDEQATPVSKSGPTHGLSLLLNVEADEYLELSETVGFKVVVHAPDAMPFPEDEGIIISPGFATSASIRRIDITRTPQPYGDCLEYSPAENEVINMYAVEYDVRYTAKACQRSCIQFATIERCDCCDKDFPCITDFNATALNSGSSVVRFCNLSSSVDEMCVESVSRDFEIGILRCGDHCAPSCSETNYEAEVSMGVWPSEKALTQLNAKFEKLPKGYFGYSGYDQDFIRKNVAKIDIFFKQLNYEHLGTKPAYDWYRLLSDLGGQMGLWLGFSLLTAVEVLGLLLNLARHILHRIVHVGSSNKVTRNTKVRVIDLDTPRDFAAKTTETPIKAFKF